jgi:hypothetical protein
VFGNSYGTYTFPARSNGFREQDLLDGVTTVEHVFKRGERLDHLAAKYFNEDEYWWVIALVNGINYPFASGGLVPGRVLKIPVDVKEVFAKLFR